MTRDETRLFLITGPPGAGKTTVARLLARRFERGVHLEGDFFRRSVVAGRHEITPELAPEAVAQLRLRYRLAVAAARAYVDARFAVVYEDVVAGPMLTEILALFEARPVHVVVLLPAPHVIAARDAARRATGYAQWSTEQLHGAFAHDTPRVGIWLDTSDQTPDETVDQILERTREAATIATP